MAESFFLIVSDSIINQRSRYVKKGFDIININIDRLRFGIKQFRKKGFNK